MLYRTLKSALAVVACLAMSSAVFASTMVIGDAVSLETLIANNDTLIVEYEGDVKMFSNFSYVATGDNPDADGVNVIPIVDMAGNIGVRVQGAFIDLPGAGGSDALLTFEVMATGNFLIEGVHLAANPNVFGANGFVGITETFLPTFNDVSLEVFDLEPGPQQFEDFAMLPMPVQKLPVQKDLILFAGENSSATLSFFDQTFQQVPEPGSSSMACFALIAGLALRRRS